MASLYTYPENTTMHFARGKTIWKVSPEEHLNFRRNVLGRFREGNLILSEVCRALDLNPAHVGRHINQQAPPAADAVKKLAAMFGVQEESLFLPNKAYEDIGPYVFKRAAAQKPAEKKSAPPRDPKVVDIKPDVKFTPPPPKKEELRHPNVLIAELLRHFGEAHGVESFVLLSMEDSFLDKMTSCLDHFSSTIKKFSKVKVSDVPPEIKKQIIREFLAEQAKKYGT